MVLIGHHGSCRNSSIDCSREDAKSASSSDTVVSLPWPAFSDGLSPARSRLIHRKKRYPPRITAAGINISTTYAFRSPQLACDPSLVSRPSPAHRFAHTSGSLCAGNYSGQAGEDRAIPPDRHAGKSSSLSTVGRFSIAVSNAAYTDRRHKPHEDDAGWHMAIPHLIGRSRRVGRNHGALQSNVRRNWKPTVLGPASVPSQIPPPWPTVRSLTANHLSTRYDP